MYQHKTDEFLFINEYGEQMTRNSIQHAIARYNKSSKLLPMIFYPFIMVVLACAFNRFRRTILFITMSNHDLDGEIIVTNPAGKLKPT